MNSLIESVASYIPSNKVSSEDMEQEISQNFGEISFGILEEMTGVVSRYFVDKGEYSSDLAIKASELCFNKSKIGKQNIDLLIFASASQDITEPATANIIQKELGLDCPVFDIKNACNSFLNGLDIADSYIKSGKYRNILVCSGETPSKVINYNVTSRQDFKKYFAGYTLGDAGAAMIITSIEGNRGILSTYLYSDGTDWDLATIMGGGSRFPHDEKMGYFSGDPSKIRDKFLQIGNTSLEKYLNKLGWEITDLTKVFVHQVAMSNFDSIQKTLEIPADKFEIILPEYGNIASCCLPTAFDNFCKTHILGRGDKFLFIGLASGFSYGLVFYEV